MFTKKREIQSSKKPRDGKNAVKNISFWSEKQQMVHINNQKNGYTNL